MKAIIAIVAIVCAGCAHAPQKGFLAPSSSAVQQSISSAKLHAAEAKQYVAAQGKESFQKLTESLVSAETELLKYNNQVDKQTKQLSQAINDANYWHDKQIKGLKEIWFWRIIFALEIAALAAFLAIKTRF